MEQPDDQFGRPLAMEQPDDQFGQPLAMEQPDDQFGRPLAMEQLDDQFGQPLAMEQPGDQFGRPLAIAIDSNDIMYITEVNKHQVMMFTAEGEFLESFGRSGKRLLDPRGVAVDKTGNVYVCDHSGEVLVSKP